MRSGGGGPPFHQVIVFTPAVAIGTSAIEAAVLAVAVQFFETQIHRVAEPCGLEIVR